MKRRCLFSLSVVMILMLLSLALHGNSYAKLVASQSDYPNAKLLISADSLQNSIGEKNVVIIDARTAGYESSHIPSAINLKFGDFFTWEAGLLPKADLESKLSAIGLKRGMIYVIYDNTSASFGAAGRVFWMLEYLGCTKVHILDGGWDKWVADGRPTETTMNTLPANTFKAIVKPSRKATRERIAKRLNAKNYAVIDARTDEEYIGWQRYGEARGGHIPGAIHIPYAWFFNTDKTVVNYSDLKTMFESRGITRNKEVTAYCTAGIRSGFVYFLLRLMGYPRASNYDGSIAEWSADTSLPMEKPANYSRVVYAGWVKDLIEDKNPPTYSGNGYIIFECSWGTISSDYDNGHIPGAIHFDTNNVEARDWTDPNNPAVTDENEMVWDLVQDSLLQDRLRNMGVNNDTTIIVYGKSSTATTRVYWAMRYAGLDVRFLNGGYEAWIANGGTKETDANYPAVAGNITVNPQNQIKALTPEILSYANYFRLNDTLPSDTLLVDVRSKEEYEGSTVGYNDPNITRKGRVPGAVWGHDADSSSPEYMDSDGTLHSYTDVRSFWQSLGITPDKTIIFYCGTGWRSTLAFLYADLMGFPNIKNYDSWYVWSTFYDSSTGTIHREAPFNDPNMPIDTGWSGP